MYRKDKYSKVSAWIFCGVIGLSLLGGCGKTDVMDTRDVKEMEAVETEVSVEEAVTEETVEAEAGDASVEAETGDASVKAETGDASVEAETENASVEAETEVINNNGYFVQVGDKVYFHGPDAESMDRSALWANYAFAECGRTVLFAYDVTTGEMSTVAYDYACGPLSVQGGIIYSSGYESTGDSDGKLEAKLIAYSPEKEIDTDALQYGSLIGAAKNDSFAAAVRHEFGEESSATYITVYKDGVVLHTYKIDGWKYVFKLGENEIFYTSAGDEYEEGDNGNAVHQGTEYLLMQMNAFTGEEIVLGALPRTKLASVGEIDECIVDEDNIYLTYASYGGSGHFYQGEGYFVQAVIGEENSISFTEMPNGESEGEYTTPFAVQDGKMVEAFGEPGTCTVNGDGTLGYFDEQGAWQPVAEGWGNIYTSDDYAYKGVEIAEKIGDDIYLVYNDNERATEDDIGWRYAYYRKSTEFYRVSIKTGEATLLERLLP